MTFCCCIKTRCLHFIESRAVPPPKREQIVKEIIQELGKIESATAGVVPPPGGIPPPPHPVGTSGILDPQGHHHMTLEQAQIHGVPLDQHAIYQDQSQSGAVGTFERQTSYTSSGRPMGSLLEERQKSIVRQLDSIHKDLNKIYEASTSVVGTGNNNTDYNGGIYIAFC